MKKMTSFGEDAAIAGNQERRAKIARFNLVDDVLFQCVMKDNLAMQDTLRVLLGRDDLEVMEVRTQEHFENTPNHSVVLDAKVTFTEGGIKKLAEVEMQRADDDDYPRRVRYYAAIIDTNTLKAGTEYSTLPELYMIFITENDFIGLRKAYYKVVRTLDGIGAELDNGVHEIYANLAVPMEGPVGELLQYMKDSKPQYETGLFPNLARQVSYYKVGKGVEEMSSVLEKERIEGRIEGKIELARRFRVTDDKIKEILVADYNMSKEEAEDWIKRYDNGELA